MPNRSPASPTLAPSAASSASSQRQCDDGSDPHVIAQVILTRIHVRDRDVALAHMLAHEVVRARGTARRQITGAVRRGTSRADIIAANAQRSSRSTR